MKLNSVEQWTVLDSTKIQCYLDCPRKYFYNYILGWQRSEPNVHLIFGEAWHKAMETLLVYGYSSDALVLAQMNLEQIYRQHFGEMSDDIRFPKTPGFAAEMLSRYCREYSRDHQEFEVLYTEVSGSVGISANYSVYFKTDSILRGISGFLKDKIFSLEHKTTSSLNRQWLQQWSLKMQIGVYTHVLNCLYPQADVYGIIVNAAVFQKTKPGFSRSHYPRTLSQMRVWLQTVRHWCEQIEDDTSTLISTDNDSDSPMISFPLNSESCTKYFGCEYHDLCVSWLNPLQHLDQVPQGFEVRHWDPRTVETAAKMEL